MSAPDHIGWDLVRAARWWEAEFIQEVAGAGHPWFAEARGRLVEHIGKAGIEQGALAERAAITKQAVGQHLDALEADGVVQRVQDPDDSRKRFINWTDAGLGALRDIAAAKLRIEARLKRRLGASDLASLKAALRQVVN